MQRPRRSSYVVLMAGIVIGVVLLSFAATSTIFKTQPHQSTPQAEPNQLSTEQAKPSVVFVPADLDLGVLKAPVERMLVAENRSQRAIRVTGVKTSCDCLLGKPDKEILQPGEQTHVKMQIEPRRDRGYKHSYRIVLHYDDSGPGQTEMILRVQSNEDIVVVPPQLTVRSIPGIASHTQFHLIDYRDKPLIIEKILTSSPSLRASVKESPKSYLPGWKYVIEVIFSAEKLDPGSYSGTVSVHTSDPAQRIIEVKVAVDRVRRIRVAPGEIRLKADSREPNKQSARVYIGDTLGSPVVINAISSNDRNLQWRLAEDRPETKILEIWTAAPDLSPLSGGSTVRISFREPVAEEICVGVAPDTRPPL